ncbi:MAG: tail fiber domain-containing protein [Candidatus Babeliales bacterium]
MSLRLDGNNPLSYMGVTPVQPPQMYVYSINPTINDFANVGSYWLNIGTNQTPQQNLWILVSVRDGIATWLELTGAGRVITLQSNSGGLVPPTAGGNIFVLGDTTTITGVGSPGTNTITLSTAGTVATSYLTDDTHSAIPALGVLTVHGTGGITTSSSGSTVSINNGGGLADSFQTDSGTATPVAGVIQFHAVTQAGSSVSFSGATNVVKLNTTDANDNTIIGLSAGNSTVSGTNNTGLGFDVLHALAGGGSNTCIGYQAGLAITTGISNTIIGGSAGIAITTHNQNTLIGQQSYNLGIGNQNTVVGYDSLSNAAGNSNNNVVIGIQSASNYTTTESNNIIIQNSGTIGDNNIQRLGTDGTGTNQVSQTFIAGTVTTARDLTVTTGNATITAGNLLMPNTNGAGTQGEIQFGGAVFVSNFGTSNTFVGGGSGNTTTTGAGTNTGVGTGVLAALTTGAGNAALGNIALSACTTGSGNVALGTGAGRAITTGGGNEIMGGNTAIGLTTGNFNIIFGSGSAPDLTTGSNNLIIGTQSTTTLITGNNNIILGQDTGTSYTGAESDNILINSVGVVGESNKIRIGVSGTGAGLQNACYVAGIAGVTTVVNDAVPVLISASTGQLGTISSSLRYKENINDMGSASEAIYKLRPVTFNYKDRSPEVKSIGLIAEEVAKVLPQLVVYDIDGQSETLKYQDLPVLLLNEIIKLKKEIQELRELI